jgi:branched-chain amino acid aminotransferase
MKEERRESGNSVAFLFHLSSFIFSFGGEMTDSNAQYVWVDGKLIPENEALIPITTLGTAGVSLVYEGIRAYWNADARQLFVLHLDAHLERFEQSIRLTRMKQTIPTPAIRAGLLDLLRANRCAEDVYIRPFAFVESAAYSSISNERAHIVINSMPNPAPVQSGRTVHACVSSWTRVADNVMPPRVKASSNYLNSRYAMEEAKRNGYDVALLLNPSGKVAEAPGACVMLVREGKLITPTITSGILESITRETIIRLCREVLQIQVVEREVDRTELYVAREAFLCGTGSEITPIASVDRFMLGDGAIGPITQRIATLYQNVARGTDPRYPEWRTAV